MCYPSHLFRAFKEKNHANDFIDRGMFFLGNISRYKNIEDSSRKDETEGEGNYQQVSSDVFLDITEYPDGNYDSACRPGIQDCSVKIPNSIYLFCCSGPDVEVNLLKEKFGEYIVKIAEPKKLVRDLNNYFKQHSEIKTVRTGLKEVLYNKGNFLKEETQNPEQLAYRQKPERFKHELEWRYVTILDRQCKFNEDSLCVDLKHRLTYVEALFK